jgi:WD40 repeat protein
MRGHEEFVRCVAISTNGEWIVSGSDDKTVRLWSCDNDREIYQLHGSEKKDVFSVAFSPDEQKIISADGDTVRLWSRQTGKPLLVLHDKHGLYHGSASPDGQWIYSSNSKNIVRVLSSTTESRLQAPRNNQNHVSCIKLSKDGTWIVLGHEDTTVRLCSRETGAVARVMRGHEGAVNCVAISSDSNWIVSGSIDMTIRLWRRDTGETVKLLSGHEKAIKSLAFNPDDNWIFSGSEDGVRIWCRKTGLETRKFPVQRTVVINAVVMDNVEWNVAGAYCDKLGFWSINIGDPLQLPDNPEFLNYPLASDGTIIVIDNGSASLWSIQHRRVIIDNLGYARNLKSVTLSQDGKWVVTSSSRQVTLWDRRNGNLIICLELEFVPLSAQLTPDSSQLMIASSNGFQIWYSTSDKRIWKLLYSTIDSTSLLLTDCSGEGAKLSRSNYRLFEQHGAIVDKEYVDQETQNSPKNAKCSMQLTSCKPPLSGTKKDEDYDDQSPREFKDANLSQARPNNNNLTVSSGPRSTSSSNNGADSSKKHENTLSAFKHGAFFNAHQSKAMKRISYGKECSLNSFTTRPRSQLKPQEVTIWTSPLKTRATS